MLVDLTWEQVEPSSYVALAIPGGFPRYGYFRACGERPLQMIRCFHQAGKPIALCVLAVSCWRKLGFYGGAGPLPIPARIRFSKRIGSFRCCGGGWWFREDENLITGDGPGAAGAVALALLSRCTSPENSERIKNLMRL